jgi:hypothetical protein
MDDSGKQLELTQELRRARNWILGVGIMMVVFDQIMFQYQVSKFNASGPLVDELRTKILIIDGVVLAFFVGMYFLARVKPVIACVLALIAFWGIQIWAASQSGESIFQGIIVKVLFTLALIRGIKSASRAEQLQSELGKVFE